MFNSYPHKCLWINGRSTSVEDICSSAAISRTDFENTTFGFIRAWLSGEKKFELNTSGSTGPAKKIVITREQMTASAALTTNALNLASWMNALTCLDTKYIAGKMMLVRSFHAGMKIFAVDPCANPLIRVPVDHTIHFTALVPLQVRAILGSNHSYLLDKLTSCLIGGAQVDEDLRERLQIYTSRIYATYGMTETISHIALQPVNENLRSEYFTAFPGFNLSTDERGCLVIQMPQNSYKVVTNDIVELMNKNEFKWLGRWDNIINSGGVKLSPESIERKIGQIFTRLHVPNSYFIHSVPDQRLGQKAVLVMESPLPDTSQLKTISDEMTHSIPSYEIPRQIFESRQFVYTETNKINRSASFNSAIPLGI
jgi:O-succinylbenzoic acid--CoA ligase